MNCRTTISITVNGITRSVPVYPDSMVSPGGWHVYPSPGMLAGRRRTRGQSGWWLRPQSDGTLQLYGVWGDYHGWVADVVGTWTETPSA